VAGSTRIDEFEYMDCGKDSARGAISRWYCIGHAERGRAADSPGEGGEEIWRLKEYMLDGVIF